MCGGVSQLSWSPGGTVDESETWLFGASASLSWEGPLKGGTFCLEARRSRFRTGRSALRPQDSCFPEEPCMWPNTKS